MFATLRTGGDQAYADLDAVTAALEMGGGAAGAAVVAVGVFFDMQDAFSSGLTGAQSDGAAE